MAVLPSGVLFLLLLAFTIAIAVFKTHSRPAQWFQVFALFAAWAIDGFVLIYTVKFTGNSDDGVNTINGLVHLTGVGLIVLISGVVFIKSNISKMQ